MLTWLAAQSGVSGRRAASLLNTDNDKIDFPIHSHISPSRYREHIYSLPSQWTIWVLNTKPHTEAGEITLINSCASVVISTEADGQFLLHLIIFDLYFKGPGVGFPVRGTWPITAWKWPNCVCTLFVFHAVSCPRVSIIIPLCINVWHAQVLFYEIEQGITSCFVWV